MIESRAQCISYAVHDTAYLQQCFRRSNTAVIAQLGERKTEDLKVSGSIPDDGNSLVAGVWRGQPLCIL